MMKKSIMTEFLIFITKVYHILTKIPIIFRNFLKIFLNPLISNIFSEKTSGNCQKLSFSFPEKKIAGTSVCPFNATENRSLL